MHTQTPGSTQNLIGRFCRKDFVELFHVFLAFCSVALLEDVRGSRADVDTRRRRAVVNLRYACAQLRCNWSPSDDHGRAWCCVEAEPGRRFAGGTVPGCDGAAVVLSADENQ